MSCQCIAIDYVRELRQVMSESCDRSCQFVAICYASVEKIVFSELST